MAGMRPGMTPQQMAMMRMRMQQQQMQMRGMEAGMPPGMMANGSGMEGMMGPNGMMMARANGPMPAGMQRMMGGGGMMGPGMGMQGGMMQHPQMQHGMSSRPPPPEYGMTSQVFFIIIQKYMFFQKCQIY